MGLLIDSEIYHMLLAGDSDYNESAPYDIYDAYEKFCQQREEERKRKLIEKQTPPTMYIDGVAEDWGELPDLSKYRFSNFGRIWSLSFCKLIKPQINRKGYQTIMVSYDDGPTKHLLVHRAVAMLFCPGYSPELQVNHIDGNKTNNRADNLEWVTGSQNMRHAFDTWLAKRTDFAITKTVQGRNRQHDPFRCIETGKVYANYYQAARELGLEQSSIRSVIKGKQHQTGGYHFERMTKDDILNQVPLYPHQKDAIERMHNACVLVGEVGSGKSRTAIAYYISKVGIEKLLYIFTTAAKRNKKEWEEECKPFGIEPVFVDSWNNIKKHTDICGGFIIFDEQKVIGYGPWTKAFLKLTKKNEWVLLTATPGDTWTDYIPVFIANGFYKYKSEFQGKHVVYKPYMKYPVVDHYVNQGELIKHRNSVLVYMIMKKKAVKVNHEIRVDYDKNLYKQVLVKRWDPYDNEPITESGKLCYLLRKVVNSDKSRVDEATKLISENDRVIIFYNFTYELNILREVSRLLGRDIGEWNGEVHSPVPSSNKWVYLCQYTAAAEGWNCISTNVIIFYSQSYSYKTTIQAAGRIDRLNTPYDTLEYYYIRSCSPIDIAIKRSLSGKRDFNERAFLNSNYI